MIKKAIAVLSVLVMSVSMLSACGKSDSSSSAKKLEDVEILNFTQPVDGEKIAVITIKDMGEIKIKFFPDIAPKGVENFIGLAEKKYYDELIIHRVEKDFCIQGGDPKGNGTGGKSMWGENFAVEPSEKLRNFTGAVAYANSGKESGNGSQFYIIDSKPENITDETFTNLAKNGMYFPENVKEQYKKVGGAPWLDDGYTVFGQVIEGLDVIEKIYNVELTADASGNANKPAKHVVIEKVEIVDYKK